MMNEVIIVAGGDYGDTALGGLGIAFFFFGGLWLAGFFDKKR